MRVIWQYEKVLFCILLVAILLCCSHIVIDLILGSLHLILSFQTPKSPSLKAFITSAYFYPKSKSLGDNAFALVMNINMRKSNADYTYLQAGLPTEDTQISVYAYNGTSSILIDTNLIRVTPHDFCEMVTVFATAQLIPNVQLIHMVSDDGSTEIPFSLPAHEKHEVVTCFAPLYVYEQWQNFILAVHVYKKFGAFMNLYLVSCVTPLFTVMQKYQSAGYLKIQPWYRVNFPYIPAHVVDPFVGIEFQNQAAAHTDCLLQYKESAQFVMFLDMDNILIPKLAPTYVEEFQKLVMARRRLAYLIYHQENYGGVAARKGAEFSTSHMLNSLRYKTDREKAGRIVADTRYVNYTWIYPVPYTNGNDCYEVSENTITHLELIKWSDYHEYETPPQYLDTDEMLMSTKHILEIEDDFQQMIDHHNLGTIMEDLPEKHHYTFSLSRCLENNYYKLMRAKNFGKIQCPGPQSCKFKTIPGVYCIHVNATHLHMENKSPITYYFATDPYFTSEIGCSPQ